MNFTRDRQPLVDAAFLAQGLLRAPRALRERLSRATTRQLVAALESTRAIVPGFNNWLLFSATVEAGLKSLGACWDTMRVDYALRQHEQWYKGDGAYGDGPEFHWDYYNSFVIHPMLVDVLDACADESAAWKDLAAARRGARDALRGRPGAAHRARRQLPADRPLDRLSLRRIPRCSRRAALRKRAARRRVTRAGPRRAHRRDPPIDRGAGHIRCERLAADRLLRSPAGRRRDLHLDRQPLSLRRRPAAARAARVRRVLVGAAAAVDVGEGVVRAGVSDRPRARPVGPSGREEAGGWRTGSASTPFRHVRPARPAFAPRATAQRRTVEVGYTTTLQNVAAAKQAGFEYVELSTTELAGLSDADFEQAAARVRQVGLPVPAAYLFLPPTLKVTGPDIDPEQQIAYVRKAFTRLARLGTQIVVFGSGPARKVPDGFPKDQAFQQLVAFGRRIAPEARARGITVTVEPQRHEETNIINSAAEGLRLVNAIGDANFQLMIDFYHLASEKEDPAIIVQAGAHIRHLHMANPAGRVFPRHGRNTTTRRSSRP